MPRAAAIIDMSPEENTARRLADLEASAKQRPAAQRTVYVTGEYIVPATIENKHIKTGTIKAEKIEAGTITATEIKAGTITAEKMNVTELSAITSNLGTITAGEIKGTTIIGATIKTAAAGARVELTSAGIKGINAAAVTKFNFDVTTGILTATAVISAEEGSTIPTKVLSGQIKETQIENEAISTPLLKANAVTAAKILAGTITAVQIAANTITAEKLSVATLSAITANLGTITAGTIEGVSFKLPENEVKGSANSLAWISGGVEKSVIYAVSSGGGKTHSLHLLAGGEHPASLSVESVDSTDNAVILAAITGHGSRVIHNSAEESSFPQLPSTSKVRIVYGSVSAAGAKISGDGFTVARPATGDYRITYSTKFTTAPVITAMDASNTQRTASGSSTAEEGRVLMSNGAGALENIAFNFIAIGVG